MPPSRPASATPEISAVTPSKPGVARFAVIGDFGSGDQHALDVARLVASWNPEFILSVGDGYYSGAGGVGSERYDNSVGALYCAWLKDVKTTGTKCPKGKAARNAFFTVIGNHDITDAVPGPSTYLDYFNLPGQGFKSTSGNERYYDFVQGSLHVFVLNSNPDEPDGRSVDSVQAKWLRSQLSKSTSRWKIVIDHHPPYSSDSSHGSTPELQWPFARWGVDAVFSGHAHVYERINRDGIVYFVNGLGGQRLYTFAAEPVSGSQSRFAANWGAQLIEITDSTLTAVFFDVGGQKIDSYTIKKA